MNKPCWIRIALSQLVLLIISACSSGSGEGLDISGRPLSEGGNVPPAPTLESIQANIFDPVCVTCHSGAAAPQGLLLDRGNSFSNLVGVPSREESSLLRVASGDPNASYLIQKMEGTAQAGEQMPFGGPPLPQSSIDYVRQWIVDGALPESGPEPDTPPVIISLTPTPDSVISTFPLQILASFDQDVDASSVSLMSVQLDRSGGDGQFGDLNDVSVIPTSVGLSASNVRLAVVDLSGVVPVEDLYRVSIRGNGPNVVRNINGIALDGEYQGSFPSGNGVQGGDFVAVFDVNGVQPTLQSIQVNVFTPVCSGCHSGPTGPTLPAGMDLSSEAASLASLAQFPSIQVPSIMRVERGDANSSYLIHKLEGTAGVGDRMPRGGPFLDQFTIDAIRSWIDNGANP